MSWWEALVLGSVQGLTEFLPVSSSGHLVITETLLGVTTPGVVFEVTVHLATLISVLAVYRRRVRELALGAMRAESWAWRYLGLLLLATLPAGAIGVAFGETVTALFGNPWVPAVAFAVTGLVLWSSKAALARGRQASPGALGALLVGLGQAAALVPGLSRSGTTVVVALWLGWEAREAAAFSFLMAVPAIAGAAVLEMPQLASEPELPLAPLLVASLAAALTGMLAITWFVALLRHRSFHRFALYVWGLALAFAAWLVLA